MGGAIERVFIAPPIPTGGGKVIAAPFQFYTTGEDNLRVISLNSLVGVTLKIQGRLVDSQGALQASSWDHTPNSDRSAAMSVLPLAAGSVLNLTVFANSGAPRIGQTFVIVQLIRGLGASAIVLGTLLQGYVTSQQALAWPGSPCISSTDGEPNVRTIGGSLPPAGADFSETVPTGARWELLSVTAGFQTSAVVANRQPSLRTSSGADIIALLPAFSSIPAGALVFLTWAQDVPPAGPFGFTWLVAPIPTRCLLLGGQTFRAITLNLQAGDAYQAPIYTVREWLEAA